MCFFWFSLCCGLWFWGSLGMYVGAAGNLCCLVCCVGVGVLVLFVCYGFDCGMIWVIMEFGLIRYLGACLWRYGCCVYFRFGVGGFGYDFVWGGCVWNVFWCLAMTFVEWLVLSCFGLCRFGF